MLRARMQVRLPAEPSGTSGPHDGARPRPNRLVPMALGALIAAAGCGGAPVVEDEAALRVELRGNRIFINQKIEFGHDSAEILEGSYPILDEVAAILGMHEEIYRVQVQGHTSTVGEEQHNQELSAARADAIATYLRAHGVTQEITAQGYGETYPVCREETDACHARNRRVEFFVDSR